MKSMTGFGRGEASNGHVTVTVEVKSVNNRFKDIQLRVPREYNVWEPRIQALLREGVTRGRLDGSVRRSGVRGTTRVQFDLALALQYKAALLAVAEATGRDRAEVTLALLSAQPGVMEAVEADPDITAEWDLCATATELALTDLDHMREAEGAALARDLRQNLVELARLRAEVFALAEGLADRTLRRLSDRIQRLVGGAGDPQRLSQEAALLADKSDIAEELARLASHCEQFEDALGSPEAVGRKLDFLLQEMNREVNTMGSKAAEHPLSAKVVELKTVLERLREQAANVE